VSEQKSIRELLEAIRASQQARAPAKISDPAELVAHVGVVGVEGYWESLETSSKTWAAECAAQPVWTEARSEATRWSGEFHRKTGQSLFSDADLPAFVGKEMPRLREKTLRDVKRKGVERVFPNGSPVPQINDLVRVRIATRFLDGVAFVAEKLIGHFKRHNIELKAEARASGYYAHHLYFSWKRLFSFATKEDVAVSVVCEIQIATELATTIWDRTHGVYELSRVAADAGADDDAWQWMPSDPRFIAAQLGNMIHLADGLVVQLRDAVQKESKK